MNTISSMLVQKLTPSVNLKRISSGHLLKHFENVCEHIFDICKYKIVKSGGNKKYHNKMMKIKKNVRVRIESSKYNRIRDKSFDKIDKNEIFKQVYKFMDKSMVLLPEFSSQDMLRLLYGILKIKVFDKNKKRRKKVLKYIEYYILEQNILKNKCDNVDNFWKNISINDMIMLFKLFVLNDCYSYNLLKLLIENILKNIDLMIPSDLVLFLNSYHIYLKKKKKINRYNLREIKIQNGYLQQIYKNIINNLNLTNKEISQFVLFLSIEKNYIILNNKIEIYTKLMDHIEKTIYMYSPKQIRSFLLYFFTIHNRMLKINKFNNSDKYNTDKFVSFMQCLFKQYNKRSIDIKIEEELHILNISLKNNYYDYTSLENIIFNIKNNISHLSNNQNIIKFINLILKFRNVNKSHFIQNDEMQFVNYMINQVIIDCTNFIQLKYKYIPWKFKHIFIKHNIYELLNGGAKRGVNQLT
ncbi:conserved protein, unknown function [Plasmodium yoelii]|uniref:Uncharacterized protein n=3 Tax=Plasmodium yoelii TaxID=5861 RepID=Q7RGK1_PLAYO|nr:conserved protein, unknown function [Plasmodium yoelii]EAA16193.1 hypothetical protein [Plasmodium yoelii yoelii]WBY59381.1 hypothetical protein Py17XNL_001205208 [Plasmodium yoelii yoelii]CDU19515.1 conserved Plasmodium protein, unknown function [Plasmodium yoelii]VTZ80151.1 conserved protein, unknown function [Plasmodium yoelii]|eukprot:XP_724628.1 conserved protein, unknown function [Plasmodium yoelii]